MAVTLEQVGGVSVLHLGDGENRFTLAWLDELEAAIERVVAVGPGALVTVGDGRFYSNGLHVETLLAEPFSNSTYLTRVEALFARVLTLPVPTVAAINGHAFGGGAMLALAHDFRLMNAEKGYFCFPEIDLKFPFSTGMAALIQAKLTPSAAAESMTTGRRYGGREAAEKGIVDAAIRPGGLLAEAIEQAEPLVGKDPATLASIKDLIYAAPVAALRARH